jgi:acetylornithine deacetylase/succinyl-diaminopimelate desuccinylase-like protein
MVHLSQVGLALAAYHRQISSQTHPLSPSPSCRVTRIMAGEAHNATPARCEMIIDRRMLPGETHQQISAELDGILSRLKSTEPSIDYRLEFLEWNEPVVTSLDSPLVETLIENIKSVGGLEPNIWGPPYGSDVRNFIYDAAIPTVNFGAGDYRVCHQPNEFVVADDLLTCARIVLGAVLDLLQQDQEQP